MKASTLIISTVLLYIAYRYMTKNSNEIVYQGRNQLLTGNDLIANNHNRMEAPHILIGSGKQISVFGKKFTL